MDWTAVGAMAELFGAVAVVASLLYVGRQIKQNTMAARASAFQELGAAHFELWKFAAADPLIATLTMRFMEEEGAEFTPQERGPSSHPSHSRVSTA